MIPDPVRLLLSAYVAALEREGADLNQIGRANVHPDDRDDPSLGHAAVRQSGSQKARRIPYHGDRRLPERTGSDQQEKHHCKSQTSHSTKNSGESTTIPHHRVRIKTVSIQ